MTVHEFIPTSDSPYAGCAVCRGGRMILEHDTRPAESIIDQFALRVCTMRGLLWTGTKSGWAGLEGGIREVFL